MRYAFLVLILSQMPDAMPDAFPDAIKVEATAIVEAAAASPKCSGGQCRVSQQPAAGAPARNQDILDTSHRFRLFRRFR